MPFNLSAAQIIIVLVIAAIVLGPRRLPGLGRGLGQGIREFGGAIRGEARETAEAANAPEAIGPGAEPRR